MDEYDGLQYLTGFLAKTGNAMGQAETIISYYAQDQSEAQKLINPTITKLAECRTSDGSPLMPEGTEKEAADFLSTHAGAVSVAYQLAEKVAALNSVIDDMQQNGKQTNNYKLGDVAQTTTKTASYSEEMQRLNEEYDMLTLGHNRFNL